LEITTSSHHKSATRTDALGQICLRLEPPSVSFDNRATDRQPHAQTLRLPAIVRKSLFASTRLANNHLLFGEAGTTVRTSNVPSRSNFLAASL
jgi:hypothetical protein